jgi:hypothetical protein
VTQQTGRGDSTGSGTLGGNDSRHRSDRLTGKRGKSSVLQALAGLLDSATTETDAQIAGLLAAIASDHHKIPALSGHRRCAALHHR